MWPSEVYKSHKWYLQSFYDVTVTPPLLTHFSGSSSVVTWEAPLGPDALRPPPVSKHAFVKFDQYRAVYFGGRRTSGFTNDVYLFDLEVRVSGLQFKAS